MAATQVVWVNRWSSENGKWGWYLDERQEVCEPQPPSRCFLTDAAVWAATLPMFADGRQLSPTDLRYPDHPTIS
jgi:hypothetical protein